MSSQLQPDPSQEENRPRTAWAFLATWGRRLGAGAAWFFMGEKKKGKNLIAAIVLIGGVELLARLEFVQEEHVFIVRFLAVAAWLIYRFQENVQQGIHKGLEALVQYFHGRGSDRLEHLAHAFVEGLQETFLLILLGFLVLYSLHLRGTLVGESLEQTGYSLLRLVLSGTHRGEVPIVVFDTSNVKMVAPRKGAKAAELVTDREPLLRFLQDVTNSRYPTRLPKAIGFDVNFHPQGDLLHESDLHFFAQCLEITTNSKCPVYLGVAIRPGAERSEWLSHDEWAPLAADIGLLDIDTQPDWGHLPAQVTLKGHPNEMKGPPALGAALAGYKPDKPNERGKWFKWGGAAAVFKTVEIPHKPNERGKWFKCGGTASVFKTVETPLANERGTIHEDAFLVDYTWLAAIQRNTYELESYQSHYEDGDLNEKLVLLGDVEGAKWADTFAVPGQKCTIPGVYLHACAAATLFETKDHDARLYELNPIVRAAADILLSVFVLAFLTWLRHRAESSRQDFLQVELPPVFALAVIAVFVTGMILVIERVFWPDFLVTALLLALHPLGTWSWGVLSAALRRANPVHP